MNEIDYDTALEIETDYKAIMQVINDCEIKPATVMTIASFLLGACVGLHSDTEEELASGIKLAIEAVVHAAMREFHKKGKGNAH
jgi:hypothetical protein